MTAPKPGRTPAMKRPDYCPDCQDGNHGLCAPPCCPRCPDAIPDWLRKEIEEEAAFEMRAAFGPGVDVVDVITGKRYRT